MFKTRAVFSGFSVDDLARAQKFYTEVMELKVDAGEMGLKLQLPNGGTVYVYSKDDHQPASFTILNFAVDNVDEAVAELKGRGVVFEHYDNMTDEDGIARGLAAGRGPDIAWFKDPAGNILSVLQDAKSE
jgi:predicted enzyme related to lactoylglutathione lyase